MEISVIIPTYNRYTLLKRALRSVFSQIYQPREVIVVDDGSTDNTQRIIEEFPNIRYFYQKNSGVSAARNKGIAEAHCKWIAFLDADDEWKPDKLQKQVYYHKKFQDTFMSYTDEIWIRNHKEVKIPKKFYKIGKDAFLENIEYCNIAPSSVLLHKKILDTVGCFDESFEVCEDYDLWLRVACYYHIGLIDEKLIIKHAGEDEQLSMKYWGMDRWRVRALEKHLSSPHTAQVCRTLLKKYTLLLKGAVKYDKISSIDEYQQKIDSIKVLCETTAARK